MWLFSTAASRGKRVNAEQEIFSALTPASPILRGKNIFSALTLASPIVCGKEIFSAVEKTNLLVTFFVF